VIEQQFVDRVMGVRPFDGEGIDAGMHNRPALRSLRFDAEAEMTDNVVAVERGQHRLPGRQPAVFADQHRFAAAGAEDRRQHVAPRGMSIVDGFYSNRSVLHRNASIQVQKKSNPTVCPFFNRSIIATIDGQMFPLKKLLQNPRAGCAVYAGWHERHQFSGPQWADKQSRQRSGIGPDPTLGCTIQFLQKQNTAAGGGCGFF
jgi:hypothetical protein